MSIFTRNEIEYSVCCGRRCRAEDARGQYEITATGGETVHAFIPALLPPDPPLELSGARQRSLERALLACGRLDGVTALLPDPDLFLYA